MYIEIDSTYRNRFQYPLQSQFKVNVTPQLDVKDAVTEGTSEYVWSGIGTIELTSIDGVTSAVSWNPSILGDLRLPGRGYFLQDDGSGELALVDDLVSTELNTTAVLETPFGDTWNTGGTGRFLTFEDSSHVYFPFADRQNNSFNGWYLTQIQSTNFESQIVSSFSERFRIMTLESPLTIFSNTGTFQLSKEPIVDAGITPLAGVWVGNTAELNTSASSVDDFYNGMFIKFIDLSSTSGDIHPTYYTVIQDYDGTTKIATLRDPVPGYVAGSRGYSISELSKDAASYLRVGSSYENKRQIYNISLNNLILPNQILESGGRPAFYPYVYVSISNTSLGTLSLINSNNPNSQRVVFRCPIGDTDNPDIATFIKLRSEQIQTLEFNIYEDIIFEVFLSNGKLFKTLILDTISPIPPNPNFQISAMFKIDLQNLI
jgi:hypothetical protein